MTTNEKIEQKVKELENPELYKSFESLARHVLAAEIEARIDEAKYYGYSYEDLSLSVKRIKELEQQLAELKQ